MDQEEVARRMAKYDLNVMPVVDDKGVLLGVITIDDIIDVLTQEQTEDVQKIGAVEPLDVPYFQTSFFTFIRKRAGWLVILFFEEFFTQTALRHYEPIMEAVKGALLYVPLLISAGGNSGSQSSTLVIRGLGDRRDQAQRLVAHPLARARDGRHARADHRRHRHRARADVPGSAARSSRSPSA